MRALSIRQKFHPFSKRPGIWVPMPHLKLVLQIFPSKCFVYKKAKQVQELSFDFPLPPKSFSAHYNLHLGEVIVQLNFEKGSVHYRLCASENGLELRVKRSPFKLSLQLKEETLKIAQGDHILLVKSVYTPLPSLELLSLGCHKKQEIEKILERQDFKEVLPFLFLLGQYGTQQIQSDHGGNFEFIHKAKEQMTLKNHDHILSNLKPLLSTAFQGIFVPHLHDISHWGYDLKEAEGQSPWDLLPALYTLIRQFFLIRKNNTLFILPHLPKELHCGRLIKIKEGDLDIEMEWSKKTLRVLKIQSQSKQTFKIHFQNRLQKCRMRLEKKSQVFKNGESLTFEPSKALIFDRFEK